MSNLDIKSAKKSDSEVLHGRFISTVSYLKPID